MRYISSNVENDVDSVMFVFFPIAVKVVFPVIKGIVPSPSQQQRFFSFISLPSVHSHPFRYPRNLCPFRLFCILSTIRPLHPNSLLASNLPIIHTFINPSDDQCLFFKFHFTTCTLLRFEFVRLPPLPLLLQGLRLSLSQDILPLFRRP